MRASSGFEFPPEQQRALRTARRLEWTTLGYLLTVVVLMYLVLGSSQAMKTAWLEDILSLIPPAVFLVANRIAYWKPNPSFPYGYHRVTSIAFLCASLALVTMGGWLLIDALIKLIQAERPTIGGMTLFGSTVWLGWLMIPVLLYSGLPPIVLGRLKLPLAETLHDKVLHTDAKMNKADWLTAAAAVVGVLGIGWGYWWADAVAAAVISVDVLHDGLQNLKQVALDLLDQEPRTVDRGEVDPLPERMRAYLVQREWIVDAEVRMREQGHVYFGEAFVVVADGVEHLPAKLEEAAKQCSRLDWRLHDISLVPVTSLHQGDARGEGAARPEASPTS